MVLVVVERSFTEPLTEERLAEYARRAGPCFELRRVTPLTTYTSMDRRRTICVYRAPDAASVRDAHDTEGIPYVAIWSATETSLDE
jgi:hypothetical protein